MKKINWLNIWINLRLVLICSIVVFLMAFTSERNSTRKLTKSVVEFEGIDNQFISEKTIAKMLIDNANSVSSLQKLDLHLGTIEKALNNHKMIEHSEVFVSIDGVLKAIVKQKTPIARFISSNESFYIDFQGTIMPLSPQLSARVPLVFGELNSRNESNVFLFLKYIFEDDFLKKNIVSVNIMSNKDVLLKNRNHDFDIEFGKCNDIDAKFNNYKAFYQKTSQDNTINNYKKINLKYDHQVICTK